MALHELPVRLAIRHEGIMINAYLALNNTMKGSVLLGSIDRELSGHADLFERWKELMALAVSIMVEKVYGKMPMMIERNAPPHEKAGNT